MPDRTKSPQKIAWKTRKLKNEIKKAIDILKNVLEKL